MNTIDRKNYVNNYLNDNLKNIEKQIELLNRQKKYCEEKINKLNNYDIFTKEEVKYLIETLVSHIENDKYILKTFDINTKSSSYHIDNMVCEYTFLYLAKDESQEKAINEIKEKYNIVQINNENYIKNNNVMNLKDISDNYIKLSFYNKYVKNMIKFNCKNENIISINIEDERYNYINDFIDELLNKKLDKRDFKLNKYEEKNIMENFIENYHDSKKLINR